MHDAQEKGWKARSSPQLRLLAPVDHLMERLYHAKALQKGGDGWRQWLRVGGAWL